MHGFDEEKKDDDEEENDDDDEVCAECSESFLLFATNSFSISSCPTPAMLPTIVMIINKNIILIMIQDDNDDDFSKLLTLGKAVHL